MTIIQIIPMFGIAGAEIMCENLIYELTKHGHKVIAISMYTYNSAITDRLKNNGIEVRYLNKKRGLDLSMIRKIKKILDEYKADVVHTHLNCAQYAMPAAILSGVKSRIHTIHNIADKENVYFVRVLNKFFFKYCHLIPVALSELVRESVEKVYKLDKSKIPVIYNGINLTNCFPKNDYAINGNFKILHIGRFSEQKNHIGLIKAFKLFHDKYKDTELWLIGEGEKRLSIEQFINENDLTTSVKLLGLQNNVYVFLHNADIFTLPSNYEGIPMTLIEAMGTGLPIVATAVGGIPDMLTDNYDALIIKNDEYSIYKSFETLKCDKEKRILFGERAKEKSVLFSSINMCDSYIKVYENKFHN